MEVYDGGLNSYIIIKKMKSYRWTLMTVGPVEDEEWNNDRIGMKSKMINYCLTTTTIMMISFVTTLLTTTVAFEEVQQTKYVIKMGFHPARKPSFPRDHRWAEAVGSSRGLTDQDRQISSPSLLTIVMHSVFVGQSSQSRFLRLHDTNSMWYHNACCSN